MGSRFAAVDCARLSVPLHTPFVTALRRTTTTDTLVVRVSDTDGSTGWGEAPQVWQVTGESLAGAAACVEEMLAPIVLGRDVDDWAEVLASVQRAVARNFGAKAAVDVAVRDLLARRGGLTLSAFLREGATTPGADLATGTDAYPIALRTDVTLSAGGLHDLAVAAVQRVAQGFSTLKMKVGTGAATDVARVRAVREAVGPDVTIRLDANQGWTPAEAVTVIRGLEDADLGVELVEQPVIGEDVEGLAWVRSRVGLPIMADESLLSLVDLERILRLQAADLVNVKLAKCGSLGIAVEQLRRAAEAGLGTMVGSMMESAIGVGAIAAVAAAHPTSVVNDLDAAWWAARSPVVGGMRYDGERVLLPDQPGSGIDEVDVAFERDGAGTLRRPQPSDAKGGPLS
jgi:L-Ala-D/L-Glu epimerase